MFRIIAIMLITLIGFGGGVWAQGEADQAPQQATKKAPKAASEVATPGLRAKSIKKCAAAEARAEELRYRHLWIAYGMVWLIIFIFVLRTWKMNQATTSELQALKRRLAKLEAPDES